MAPTAAAASADPNIVDRLAFRNDRDLAALIHDGLPSAGMPGIVLPSATSASLVRFVRQLQSAGRPRASACDARYGRRRHRSQGIALNRGDDDVQLLTDDGRVRLLRKAGDARARGDLRRRLADLSRSSRAAIDSARSIASLATNVATLAPAWVFPLAGSSRLEVTPVVVGGIMYITSVNECMALDAGNGREIWRFKRPRTKGLAGDAAGGINRGVAIAGDRLFMVTDHAHLLALNRFTGTVLWDADDRRLAPELRRDVGAARVRQSRGLGNIRRRRGDSRIPRGVRSDDRQGSLARLDRARARRAGIRDVEGQRHRSSRARRRG